MTQDDELKFVAYMADVLAFYRKDASKFALDVWVEACRPFDLSQITAALSAHARDPDRGSFCPMPSDIVRQLAGTAGDRAALAWGRVFESMKRIGAYTDVAFDDPAIHACIRDLGGWPALCRSQLDEMGFIQSRFVAAHRAYTSRGEFDYPAVMIGDRGSEADFQKRGMKPPAPVLIGNAERAQLVIANGGAREAGPARLGNLIPMIGRAA